MNKLPVGQIIREAYVFTFGEIGTVIGLIWIPTLINTIASYFFIRSYTTIFDSLDTGTPPSDAYALLPLPLAILSSFLVSMIGVALVRQALGLRKGAAFAHVAIGGEELRTFAGFIGAGLLTFLFLLLFMLVVGAVTAVAGSTLGAAGGAVGALATVLGFVALVYAVIRLTFLLVPSVVVDGHFGLTRGWQLAGGNVGRIVLILLGTLLPLVLASDIATALIAGPPPPAPTTPPADLAGVIHSFAEQSRSLMQHLPALMGVSLVLAPLIYSQLFTSAALAYRVLSGKAVIQAHSG